MKLEYYKEIPNENDKMVSFTRDAGRVSRMHTYGVSDYSVGQHTYNMMQMLLHFWPKEELSLHLATAVMLHDVPEVLLGDIPSPAKSMGDVGSAFHELEHRVFVSMYHYNPLEMLTDLEKTWLRTLDVIELYLWILEEIGRGNRSYKMKCILKNMTEVMGDTEMPLEVVIFGNKLIEEGWQGVVPKEVLDGM